MNYFKPGLREIARKLGRQRHRLRTLLARRELTQAETALGLLGWQQAEFDAPTQAEVDKINTYEREQARLTNESAGLAKELRELRAERDAARKSYEEQRRAMESERAGIDANHPEMEKQLGDLRKAEPTFERRMPALDRELREIGKLYNALLTSENQSPSTKAEILRLRERNVSLANEKSELRNQHLRTVSAMREIESALERDRATLAGHDQRIRELQTAYETEDSQLAGEIRTRDREKARLEKEINAIETAKANPYLQIGRVLADSDVAPMNQPGALAKVKRLRSKLVEWEDHIRLSLEATALENREALKLSLFLWGTIAFVALLLVFAAFPHR